MILMVKHDELNSMFINILKGRSMQISPLYLMVSHQPLRWRATVGGVTQMLDYWWVNQPFKVTVYRLPDSPEAILRFQDSNQACVCSKTIVNHN